MEQIVETLKQNEVQTRVEKDMIIENLNRLNIDRVMGFSGIGQYF